MKIKNLQTLFFAPLLVVLSFFVFGCKMGGSPDGKFKRYPYDRVHIQYEVSGGMRGKEDVYIADFGRLEVRYSDLEILDPKGVRRNRSVVLNKGADIYTANIDQVEAFHTRIPMLDSLYQGQLSFDSPKEFSDHILTIQGLTPAGQDTILGNACDKWRSPDAVATLWISKGLMLRKSIFDKQGGTIEEIAIAIDTNWKVDSTLFTFPANVKFKEKPFGVQ